MNIERKKTRTGIYIGIILILTVVLGLSFFYSGKWSPTSYFKNKIAGITFQITQQPQKNPKLVEATIDPAYVKVGDIQTITVKVIDPSGIVSVKAVTTLDERVKELSLKTINDEDSCTNCVWEASWKVNGTSHNIYNTQIIAKNSKNEINSVTISWIDPCSPPLSGAWTLDGNCNISTTNGLEMGTFTIPTTKTLTLLTGGTWVYEAGYPIIVDGTIAISGGVLKRSLLWVLDADGDGYASSTASQVATTTGQTLYIRRKDASGLDDCYDGNVNAHPGQITYYATNRGDGSFDYDCNGSEDQSLPIIGSCTYSGGKGGSYFGVSGWEGSVPACGVIGHYYGGGNWGGNAGCGGGWTKHVCR